MDTDRIMIMGVKSSEDNEKGESDWLSQRGSSLSSLVDVGVSNVVSVSENKD